MHLRGAADWFTTINGVVYLTVLALPVAVLLLWVLARRRQAVGEHRSTAWKIALADVGMVYGTVPWVWMTMLPGSRAGEVPGRVSLVPFRDLVHMDVVQIAGNLFVLFALGCFAPLRWKAMASLPRILALGAGCSLLIEVAQYVLRLDRVSSVDDVLVNAVGAVLGALVSRHWWRSRRA